MTRIDRDTIHHLEVLSQIHLDDEEAKVLGGQLERIVAFVEKLSHADTAGVEPTGLMAHDDASALRDDTPRDGLDREAVLSRAPDRAGEFFSVPRVLGGGGE